MAYILLLQEIADRALRRDRMFRDHIDPFSESDEFLFGRFRLPRPVLIDLCNHLEPALRSHTLWSNPVPPHVPVLLTLGFLATGTFQRELGDRVDISQPSISRALPRVVDAINQLATQYIKFPYTAEDQVAVKRGFHNIAGLPNTIDPFTYLNRKQYHSINIQLICDSNNHLLNVVSRFPGGAHDSYIFQNSSMGTHLEQGAAGDAWLIGDRGYALRVRLYPALNDPHPDPDTTPQSRFNAALGKCRDRIEMTFWVIKCRFNCLRGLRVRPEGACGIITACVVLHNIAMMRTEQTPHVPLVAAADIIDPVTDHPTGAVIWQAITAQYFTHQ
uniref:DDE Tnp4 domain-containing protein n=1 Tax=Sparus aurata TaxID=8175 RepID=A0A671TGD0_SPAAU